jgi:sulfoxide reductase heme-binding subunit YedZ
MPAASPAARPSVKSPGPGKRWLKPVVFLLCLVPLGLLTYNAFTGKLSANPIDDITDTTGDWTLRFVMITLSVTPLRKIFGWNFLGRVRRMLGLFTFTYATLHFTTYIWLDQFFDLQSILKDIPKRPFILVGFTAFTLFIPLAITSTAGWVRRLGGKRWQLLHRLVYVSATAGVVHYLWLVKADKSRPLIYGAILATLLGYRLFEYVRKRQSKPVPARSARNPAPNRPVP